MQYLLVPSQFFPDILSALKINILLDAPIISNTSVLVNVLIKHTKKYLRSMKQVHRINKKYCHGKM